MNCETVLSWQYCLGFYFIHAQWIPKCPKIIFSFDELLNRNDPHFDIENKPQYLMHSIIYKLMEININFQRKMDLNSIYRKIKKKRKKKVISMKRVFFININDCYLKRN